MPRAPASYHSTLKSHYYMNSWTCFTGKTIFVCVRVSALLLWLSNKHETFCWKIKVNCIQKSKTQQTKPAAALPVSVVSLSLLLNLRSQVQSMGRTTTKRKKENFEKRHKGNAYRRLTRKERIRKSSQCEN